MLKKILKIKNVGRFFDYNSNLEDLAFSENTLIFGENTNGKSTLAAILRSLKDGDNEFLDNRKTFGFTGNQEVKILFDSVKEYKKDNWEEKNIEIFDNDFIKDNVFDSDAIGDEQKAGLYGIFVGSANRKLSKNIKVLKKEQTELETKRDQIKNENFKESMEFANFLKLKEISAIGGEISKKEKNIKQQENVIVLKSILKQTVFKSDFKEFKKDFKKKLDTSVENLISEHIKNTWNDEKCSHDILDKGVKLLKKDEEKCIFCGQGFESEKSKKLIQAFREKFNVKYDLLKNTIKVKGDKFLNIDFEKEQLKFKNLGVDIVISQELIDSKKEIDKKVENKQKDLNLSINFVNDENFIIFETEFEKIKKNLVKVEKGLSNSANDVVLKQELEILKINKKRFEKDTKDWIGLFKEMEKKIEEKRGSIKKETEKLAKNVNKIFKENKDNINYFLKQVHADFRINKFEPKKHMGKRNPHYCEYNFIFDKYEVEEDKFKITFSDSDKRLLAFAMFLSKLKNDNNLENKIIVLDDPFSSFDENRKEKTVICLRCIKNDNGKEPKQKIILTHEKGFLVSVYKNFKKNSQNMKVLKIHRDSGGSKLETVDIENDFIKETYFKDLEYIKDAIGKNINLNEALKKARPCMEHVLKRKYYFYLSLDTLKTKSITTYIDEIGDKNLSFKKQDLFDLNLHEEMHDTASIFSDTEIAKINKLNDTLKLIEKI